MRTIKFRGFSKEEDQFVYGFLFKDSEYYIVENNSTINIMYNILVEKDSVGQFTGLYDINGKEIYEGDIVRLKSNIGKVDYSNDYVIIWSDEECSFVLYEEDSEYYGSKTLTRKLIKDKELVVIGNFYENQTTKLAGTR
jgi:uncharacterized phage protein (TIGR01671 family)